MSQKYMMVLDNNALHGHCVKADDKAYALLTANGYTPKGLGFDGVGRGYFPWGLFNIHEDGSFTNGSRSAEGMKTAYLKGGALHVKNGACSIDEPVALQARARRLSDDAMVAGNYAFRFVSPEGSEHNAERVKAHYIEEENEDKYYGRKSKVRRCYLEPLSA